MSSTSKVLAPGVVLTQTIQSSPPLIINALVVDASGSGLTVEPEVANGSLTDGTGDIHKGRESVAAFVSRTGVVAAVNGDYFPYTGDPLGLGISDGEIYSEPYRADDGTGRAAMGWLPSGRVIVGIPALQARLVASDGTSLPITGIDRLTSTTDPADVCLVTPRFGPTSGGRGLGTEIAFSLARPFPIQAGKPITTVVQQVVSGSATPIAVPEGGFVVTLPVNSPLAALASAHFRAGDRATLSIDVLDATPSAIGTLGGSWNRVRAAVGGGPILVRDGRIVLDDTAEHLGGLFSTAPHARTAIGQRRDGKIVIVTVDSGSALSGGMSLADLASLMSRMGAVDAINLDGGGSTTMAAQGGVTLDYPSGAAFERPVADIVAVRSLRMRSSPVPSSLTTAGGSPSYSIEGVPTNPLLGQSYRLSVARAGVVLAGGDRRALWSGPVGACGFISQDGVLHITGSGHGTVLVRVDGENITGDVNVAAPAPTVAPVSPNAVPADAPDAKGGGTSVVGGPAQASSSGAHGSGGTESQVRGSAPR